MKLYVCPQNWHAELSGSERRAAASIGFDAQSWDTKKYLAHEQRTGRGGRSGAAALSVSALLLAAFAWLALQLADDAEGEKIPHAAFWEVESWNELNWRQKRAAAGLDLDLESEEGWECRFERAAQCGQAWHELPAEMRERGSVSAWRSCCTLPFATS